VSPSSPRHGGPGLGRTEHLRIYYVSLQLSVSRPVTRSALVRASYAWDRIRNVLASDQLANDHVRIRKYRHSDTLHGSLTSLSVFLLNLKHSDIHTLSISSFNSNSLATPHLRVRLSIVGHWYLTEAEVLVCAIGRSA